jgi:hypothetical protein
MTLLRDTVLDVVKQQQLKGGPAWAAERLLGRVRYLAGKLGLDLSITDDFDKLDAVLKPLSDRWVDGGAFFSGERFSIQELLDDIATMRAAGKTAHDLWWLRVGWDDAAPLQTEETVRRLLNEEYRRIQIIYCEIVRTTFPLMADPASYFAALPVRWSFTVVNAGQLPGHHSTYWRSSPVASWDEAGADVAVASRLVV